MIYSLVNDCIISEKERGLSEATIKELKRYLHEFAEYFQKKLTDIENLTSDFLRQYVEHRGKGQGTDLVKAVVWSLRKFGAFLRASFSQERMTYHRETGHVEYKLKDGSQAKVLNNLNQE